MWCQKKIFFFHRCWIQARNKRVVEKVSWDSMEARAVLMISSVLGKMKCSHYCLCMVLETCLNEKWKTLPDMNTKAVRQCWSIFTFILRAEIAWRKSLLTLSLPKPESTLLMIFWNVIGKQLLYLFFRKSNKMIVFAKYFVVIHRKLSHSWS